MKNRISIFVILYAIMVASFIILVGNVAISSDSESMGALLYQNAVSFMDDWTMNNGDKVKLNDLSENRTVKTNQQFVINNTIPLNIEEGASLCFKTRAIFYKVYIDGVLRYEPEKYESFGYNKSYGDRINSISLYKEDQGKNIQIKITTPYKDSGNSISDIVICNGVGYMLKYLKERMVAIFASLLLLFFGIVIMCMDIPLNMRGRKKHELLYLGMSSICLAIWSLCETGVIQIFTGDSRLNHTATCCSLMLVAYPIIMYFEKAYGFTKASTKNMLLSASILGQIVCYSLHMLGIADFHQTLIITHAVICVASAVIVVTLLKKIFGTDMEESRFIFKLFRVIGVIGLLSTTIIDIVRHYVGATTDSIMFVRFGLVLFMLCFSGASLEQSVNAVKSSAKIEMISQLAYKDGLTGVGNRTAFMERLEELDHSKNYMNEIIIVMFDVNDLKYINDKMGHQLGDDLIVKSANIITKAFEPNGGKCYRIGGDEFVTIITGDVPLALYKQGMHSFESMIAEHNANPDKKFRISIAYGSATYNESNRDKSIKDIWNMADAYMYRNKTEMKANMIAANEYYTGKLFIGRM